MKKLTALTFAILLALSLMQGASAATYTAGVYYTIDYPDTLTLDDATYTDELTDDSRWLYLLYDEDYLIDATLEHVTGYEGESLYNADQDERDAYVADTLAAYADDDIALVREITTVSGFPFYIYSREGTDGAFYFAETIANGTSVNFTAYYADAGRALDDDLLEALTEVLITLRPVDDTALTAQE